MNGQIKLDQILPRQIIARIFFFDIVPGYDGHVAGIYALQRHAVLQRGLDQIAYLHKQSDMTVILVSHSMEDIARYADRIIVMNKGSVMYNGAPKEVFAHYQELEKIGLAAPQVTYVMHDLKEKGLPVKVNVTTVEEAADEIMQALEKKI